MRSLKTLTGRFRDHVGAVPNPISSATRNNRSRIRGVGVTTTVCPYCAVGCSQLVHTADNRIINIEGNPESPINRGTLCPKGAATFSLVNNPYRLTRVKYRAPHADRWEEKPLDWAMNRITSLVKATRDSTFQEYDHNGSRINRTLSIGHLGGATLDNEENYLIKKLFTAGLGIVAVENQARI